jgi:hypothetical protein
MGSSQYKYNSEDIVTFIAVTHFSEPLKSTKQSNCSLPYMNTMGLSTQAVGTAPVFSPLE